MSRTRSEHLKVLLANAKQRANIASANSIAMDYTTQNLDTNVDTFQMNSNTAINQANQMLAKTGADNSDRSWYKKWIDTSHSLMWDFTNGLYNFADDIFDFLVISAGEIGGLFGADKQWAKDTASFDWTTYATEASTLNNSLWNGDIFSSDYWDSWSSAEALQREQAMRTQVWTDMIGQQGQEFLSGLSTNLGYMIPSLAMGNAFGATASLTTTGVGALGGQTSDAYSETGDYGRSFASGVASAVVEVASELVVGKTLEGLNLGTGKIAGMFKSGKAPAKATNFIKDFAKTMFEEGVEEGFSAVMQPAIEAIYKGREAWYTDEGKVKVLDTDFWLNGNDSVLGQSISGSVLGGVLGGVSLTQQYKAIGKDGVNIENLLEKNRDLYKELGKYEKTDPKYNAILEEMSANSLEIATLLEHLKQNGTEEQIKNVAMLMGAPTQLIQKFNAEGEAQNKAINKAIDRRVKQLQNNDRFGTVNLFNELQDKYGTDYRIKFQNLKGNKSARVNHSRKEILINNNLKGEIAPVLAHEYMGHVIGDGLVPKTRQNFFDKVVKTKWFQDNAKELRKVYNTTNKEKWQGEIIDKYLEEVLTQSSNAKSVKLVGDVFIRNTLLDRIKQMFQKNSGYKLLKNNSILNEFTKSISKLMKLLDAKVNRALRKHLVGQALDEKEKKIYEQYKELFDFMKDNFEGNKYSIQIHGQKFDINANPEDYFAEFENQLSDIEYVEKMVDGYEETFVNKKYITRVNKMAMEVKSWFESYYDPNNFDVEFNDLTVEELEQIHDMAENLRGSVEDVVSEIENCDWEDEPYYDDLNELVQYFDDVDMYIEEHIEEVQEKELEEETEENIENEVNKEETEPTNIVKVEANHIEKIEEQKVIEKEKNETKTETKEESEKQTPSVKLETENLEPFETNKAKEIKEGMQEKEGKVIKLSKVEEIYDRIESAIQNVFGDTFKIKNKKGKARRLFEEYNISKNSAKKENCRKFIHDLLNQEVGETGTYADYIQYLGMDLKQFTEEAVNLLYETLNAKAVDSETTQKIDKLNKIINTLSTAISEHKATIKFIKTLNQIRSSLTKQVAKFGNTGQLNLSSGIKAMYASFFAQFRYTKNDYVSMSNLDRLQKMVNDGTFNKFIDSILYQSEDINNLDELVKIADNIKMLAEELVASKVDGQTHMNYEQTMLFVNMNKAIYKLYTEQRDGVMEKARDEAKVLIERAKEVAQRYKQSGFRNFILEQTLDALSPREIIAFMCGGSETKEFKMIYEELYRDPYLKQISKQTDFLKMRDERVKILTKLQNQKITVDGIKMKKYVLYQFYLNTKSPDNVERMKKGGIQYKDKTTHKLSYDVLETAVKERVNGDEIAELDALFDLYNGEVKEYVEKISEDLYGYRMSRADYYPICSADEFKIQDLAGGQQMKYTINAMENGRLKKLSNRKTVIEMNVNPLLLFNDYIESMTITGEIGKASQDLNRLFQLKNSDGENFISVVSQYVPNARKYMKSIFSKLIGNVNTVERNSLLDKLIGRWATSTLGLNIRSMFKQFGSFFTAWAKVGVKNSIKAIVTPAYWKAFKDEEVQERLANNPVFKHRIYNNEYIKGVTLSAGAQEFASTFTRKVINFTMKGMELLDKLTCYATYTLAQAQVETTTNFQKGSKKYNEAVDNAWSDIILETQSNSNRIAMSMIRSGEKGWVAKNVFGLFQADSQNKANLLFTTINDEKQLRYELKVMKEELENAKDTDKPEIQKKIDEVEAKIKKVNMRGRAVGAGLVASAVWVALADMLADWLYDKDEPEDETFIGFIGEVFSNATLEWLPYFNTIYNWFKYDGAELSAFNAINELIDVIKKFGDGEITRQDYINGLIKALKLFGLPVENFNKLVEGFIGNFNPELALKYKSIYYSMSQTYLTKTTNEQIEKGHDKKALGYMSINHMIYKFDTTDAVLGEILNLKKNGEDISIRNIPSSYKDENGIEIVMTQQEVQEFKQYYNLANNSIEKVMSDPNYQTLSMNEKAKVIKTISDAYYEYALYKATGQVPTSRIGQLLAKSNGQINLELMALLTVKLSSLTGNNRKVTIIKELNKVKGLTKNEKFLVLKLLGFSTNEDNKRELITFLTGNGFSQQEAESWV